MTGMRKRSRQLTEKERQASRDGHAVMTAKSLYTIEAAAADARQSRRTEKRSKQLRIQNRLDSLHPKKRKK